MPRIGRIACVSPEAALLGGAAGRIALDDEELAAARLLLLTVGELARKAVVREGALAAGQVAGLAGRGPRPRCLQHLRDQRLGDRRVLLQVVAELLVDEILDQAPDVAGAEFCFGLALELGLRELDRDHRGQALAGVVPAHALGRFLAVLVVVRDVAVQRAGERRAEADQVGAAVDRVDVVREGIDALVVGLVVLERDLDVDGDLASPVVEAAVPGQPDRRAVEGGAAAVQVLDEGDQAAFVTEVVALAAAFVVDLDAQAGVQEGELAQALREYVERKIGRLEDLVVRPEGDLGPRLVGGADRFQRRLRLPALIDLSPDLAVAPDLERELGRQRVDHGHAHAVQAAGYLVGAVVELAARVQGGHHHLGGGPSLGGVHVDRDAAAVVRDGDAVVLMDDDRDLLAVAGNRFVDRVVDDLVDEVVETLGTGGPDVHRGPFSDRLEAFENLDRAGVVAHLGGVPVRNRWGVRTPVSACSRRLTAPVTGRVQNGQEGGKCSGSARPWARRASASRPPVCPRRRWGRFSPERGGPGGSIEAPWPPSRRSRRADSER